MFKSVDTFGIYGGTYVPKDLEPVLDQLKIGFEKAMSDPKFLDEIKYHQRTFIGRPTPLFYAKNSTKILGGAKLYFKLEGLAQTGAHKINNALGQCLLAKSLGKTRVIAETGAGQHGLATASAAALLGLECTIYMGANDVKRQRPNVYNMEMFGAEVVSVSQGNAGLADAVDVALAEWVNSLDNTHYVLGSVVGPAPFPTIVKTFQSIIGKEIKEQAEFEGLDIEAIIACVGGGSNAMGAFSEYLDTKTPRLIGVEGGGTGDDIGMHAKRLSANSSARVVEYHGYRSKFLLDDNGKPFKTHSISAGIDYLGVGPEMAYLHETGRVEIVSAKDIEVLNAVKFASTNEGVLFALESAHALAHAIKLASKIK